MDPLSITANVIGIIQAPVSLSRALQTRYHEAIAERTEREVSLLARNYGEKMASVITLLSPQTARQYEILDTNVLNGGDEEIRVFRQTITDESNMTAIAGAIIAQVAITGLSLPYLSSTHWTSQGCLLLATVSGCLAVYYACGLQRTIGRLYNPAMVKAWLKLIPSPVNAAQPSEADQRASLAAILIIGAPFFMVRVSIFSYLTGLVIYESLLFTKDLDTSTTKIASRDSFITLMVGTGLFFGFSFFVFATKDIESTLSNSIRGNALSANHHHSYQAKNIPHEEYEITANDPRESVRESRDSLTKALQDAAEAHRRCSEADLRVANEFTALIASNPTPSEDHT